ncbi:AraC family transcriptional regulator [Pelomonas sp. SE-A7]|uniref:AraC family transcriptional regulator n=1 Tax=Pelomonas sp. SE-A7 TaxID=3054953 RepID=UPI00259CB954|nr:AraC family transcriptional regulator [Pelomonas sp. SE-A7]MDM4764769.1 AraC family transcriptional regulator [Pelomonas sp. SE-A7]
MNASAASESVDRRPTTIAGYAVAMRKALEDRGVDPVRVFRAAGVSQELSNDPLNRLSIDEVTRLFRVCVEVTHDPYFGLVVAKFLHASNLHALGHALLASTSLLDFCRRLERYFRLASQVATIEVVERPGEVALVTHPLFDACAETEDAWLAIVVRFMREMFKRDYRPIYVQFRHERPPGGAGPYERYFGCKVDFGNADATLVFDRAEMDRPLPGACPEIAQANDQLAATYLAKIERSDTVAMVRSTIVGLLSTGDCTRQRVADALHLSEATLQQRLAQRNTSFQALLDETRRELACNYVQQASMSVTEITFLLGFTDVSNFTRAFKRWTGKSPTSYRKPGL